MTITVLSDTFHIKQMIFPLQPFSSWLYLGCATALDCAAFIFTSAIPRCSCQRRVLCCAASSHSFIRHSSSTCSFSVSCTISSCRADTEKLCFPPGEEGREAVEIAKASEVQQEQEKQQDLPSPCAAVSPPHPDWSPTEPQWRRCC